MRVLVGFSLNDVLGVLQKIMNAFKQLMGWLGILVLPDESEKTNYPGHDGDDTASDDSAGG